jgi:hypothetical protein
MSKLAQGRTLKKILLSVIFFILAHNAHARFTVRVIEKTRSGNTIILNIGSLSQIKPNDRAVLVSNDAIEGEIIKSDIVANIRAVKVDDSESVWYASELHDRSAIKKGAKFIMMAPRFMLKGRKKFKGRKKSIIKTESQKLDEVLEDYEAGYDKSKLVKHGDRYFKYLDAHMRDTDRFDEELELADIYEWMEKEEGKGRVYPMMVYRSPYKKEFDKKIRLETFEKIVMGYLKKANDEYYIPAEFYDQINNSKKHLENFTLYAKYLEDKRLKQKEMKERYDEIYKKGPDWSDDVSDEDLATIISEYGVASEQKRRESIFLARFTYNFHLSMGLNLQNNETPVDTTSGRERKTDWSGGVEIHLFNRYPKMEDFTIEWTIRRAYDSLGVAGNNDALTSEWSGAFSLDYHPFVIPGVTDRNVFFLGTTIRLGRTKLSVPNTGAQAMYNSNSFLGLRAGVKYSFQNGLGLRLMGSMETIRLDKTESNNVGVTGLPDVADYTELKLTAGLTYFL